MFSPKLSAVVVLLLSLVVTACGGGDSATAPVQRDPPRATTISLSTSTITLDAIGATEQLIASVRDQFGGTMQGASITWSVADQTIATVSSTGLVTSVANGSTSVTASSGGLTATATVNVQQVAASVALSPSDTTIFITALLRVTAEDARGQPITAPEIEWSSQSPQVATVTDGLVRAASPGLAMIIASSGHVSATASVSVQDPQSPSDLIPSYPYVSAIDQVLVGSDISQAFSDQHVDHMKKVWDYMSGIWAKRRSDRLEWYYSPDRFKTLIAIDLCPTQAVNADARLLTACYGGAYPIWFIEPFVIPDFGTQLHEMSHDFVFPTYWGSADFPWFAEGSGMYYEGGRFQPDGSLDLTQPLPWLIQTFDFSDGLDQLVGLDALLWLNRDQFYLGETPPTYYAQAGFFWYYLETRHPSVVNELIAQLNGVDPWVRNNQWVLDFILSGTGMTIAQLNEAYLALARSF